MAITPAVQPINLQSDDKTSKLSAAKTILSAGLVVGVFDTLLAVSLFRASPYLIYQSIASGLLGLAAYEGGIATAALGMFLHFFIATTAAAVYWTASRILPIIGLRMVRNWFPLGLLYGVVVYYFMQMVVHLSRFPVSNGPKPLWRIMGSIIGHAFLVGLPIAWFTHRHAQCESVAGK